MGVGPRRARRWWPATTSPTAGMAHVAACVAAIRARVPGDARRDADLRREGRRRRRSTLLFAARPDVLNHNLETVARLQRAVRPSAGYARSLAVLARAKAAGLVTKSGLIVGMGETDDEVDGALADLAGDRRRHRHHRPVPAARPRTTCPVARWVEPAEFDAWKRLGEALGIGHVEASPLTRSSYHARQAAASAVPVALSVRFDGLLRDVSCSPADAAARGRAGAGRSAAVRRRAVGRWRNSFGPWALLPGPSTPVMTNWASGNIAPSMPMNGIVPPSPNGRAGRPNVGLRRARRGRRRATGRTAARSSRARPRRRSKVTRAP